MKIALNNSTPEAMTIDATTAETIFSLLRKYWPTLEQQPDTEQIRVLNHIQKIVEKEGLEALTPARFRGLKEIFEEVVWTDPIHG